jgi:hypothetical protein
MQTFGLPGWLVGGLALAAAFTLGAALLFLLGPRLLPPPETDRGRRVDDDRRREEIRGFLRYIGEPFVEDHQVGGETVAFYLPERDVAVTFDPRAYFRFEGAATHAVLAEHEMPGAALGHRLPFETPTPGSHAAGGDGRDGGVGRAGTGDWQGSGSRDVGARGVGARDGVAARREDAALGPATGGSTAAAFATLGLPPSAGVEAVRDAYREQVKAVHPDQGGDREAFQQLREAYAVALEATS